MAYTFTLFDGGTIPTQLGDGSISIGPGDAQTQYVSLPNGREWDGLKTGIAHVPHVTYSQSGLLVGTSNADLLTKVNLWMGKVGRKGTLTRVADDGTTTHTLTARLTSVSIDRSPLGPYIVPIEYTWESNSWPWSGTAYAGTLTGTVNVGFTLPNTGNRIVHPTLSFVPAGSPLTRVQYYTAYSYGTAYWQWDGTVPVGGTLTINCANLTISNNGTSAYSGFSLLPTHSIDGWVNAGAWAGIYLTGCGTATQTRWAHNEGWA